MVFGPDRPLPTDFAVPAIAPPKRKPKFIPNKPKYAVAKITRGLKQGILDGAAAHGFDGEGQGELEGYFQMCAAKYPKHYLALIGKIVPLTIDSNATGNVITAVNIVSIPSGNFLSQEDIERVRATRQIEHISTPDPQES